MDHALLRLTLYCVKESINVLRQHTTFFKGEFIPETAEERRKRCEAFWFRFIVDAVDEETFFITLVFAIASVINLFCYKLRDFPVGEQHELFNQFVCILNWFSINARWFFIFVENELHFIMREADGARFTILYLKFFCEGIQNKELVMEKTRAVVENLLRFFIGKAFVRVDDRASKPFCHGKHAFLGVAHHIGTEGEYSRERKLVFSLVERTEVVREHFGEHGNNTVNEVNGCRAIASFVIDCHMGFYECRNISDVDTDLYRSIYESLYGECIVEVFCICRVDGKCRHTAKITAPLDFGFEKLRSFLFDVVPFALDFLWEFHRKSLFQHNGTDLRFIITGRPNDFDNLSLRAFLRVIPMSNANECLLFVASFRDTCGWDEDVDIDARVLRDKVILISIFLKSANEGHLCAL